jgi:hypothetical protein
MPKRINLRKKKRQSTLMVFVIALLFVFALSTSVFAKVLNLGTPSDSVYVQGNLGVGTSAPGQKLDVNGTIKAGNLNLSGLTSTASRMVTVDASGNFGAGNLPYFYYAWSSWVIDTPVYIGTVQIGGNGSSAGFYYTIITQGGANGSGSISVASVSGVAYAYLKVDSASTENHQIVAARRTDNSIIDFYLMPKTQKTYTPRIAITKATSYRNDPPTTPVLWDYTWDLNKVSTVHFYVSGNIGVSITNPTQKLHVNGGAQLDAISYGVTPGESQALALSTVEYVNSKVGGSGGIASGTTGQTLRHNGTSWVANSTLYNNGTNVGVGTTNPTAKLHVYQSGTGYLEPVNIENPGDPGSGATRLVVKNSVASFYLQAYGSAAPGSLASSASIVANAGSKLLLGASAGLPVQIYSNGQYSAPQFTVASSGNVGIGISNPGSRLDINQGTYGLPLTSGAVQTYGSFRISPTSPTYNVVLDMGIGGTSGAWLQSTLRTNLSSTYPLLLNPNGGNVGIGTTNPTQKLHVNGGAQLDAISFGTTPGESQALALTTVEYVNAKVGGSGGIASGTSGQTLRHNGTSWVANSLLYNNGTNIGIGYTNPARDLVLAESDSGDAVMQFQNSTTGYTAVDGLYLGIDANEVAAIWNYENTGMDFGTNNASRMFITSNGNVGIGTTNPTYKLDVNGLIHGSLARLSNRNAFGDNNMFVTELNNYLFSGNIRFNISQTGFTNFNAAKLFNGGYDDSGGATLVTAGNTGIITIDLTKDNGVNGVVYSSGYLYVSFYHTYIPASVSARMMDRDGVWYSFTNPTNVSNNSSYAVWRLQSPGRNYMTTIEITINAQSAVDTWVNEIDLHLTRPSVTPYPILDKFTPQNLYYTTTWKNSLNASSIALNPNANSYFNGGNLGVGTTNPTQKLHVAGVAQLDSVSFGVTPGSGQSLALATVEYVNNSVSASGGLWSDNGTSIYYNSGNVGIGTSAPAGQFDIVNAPSILLGGASATLRLTSTANTMWLQGLDAARTGTVNNIAFSGSSGTNRTMDIDLANQRVGIGTSAPGSKLHVHALSGTSDRELLFKGSISDAADDAFFVTNGTTLGGVFVPSFVGFANTSNNRWSLNFRGLVTSANDASDSSSYGLVDFSTYRTSSSVDPLNGTLSSIVNRKLFTFRNNTSFLLTILASGNVGIATTNPGTKLDVNGSFISTSATVSNLAGSGNTFVMSDNSGNLYTQDGITFKRTAIADASYNAQASDYIIAYTSLTADRTVTLPTSVCTSGRAYIIVNETGGAFNVVVDPESTATISGMTSISLPAYNSIPVYCNGTNWFIY